jgi:flavodoxin
MISLWIKFKLKITFCDVCSIEVSSNYYILHRAIQNMNALIVYDSQFGNTKMVARVIAAELAKSGKAKAIHISEAKMPELKGIDLLVVGSPTQAWKPMPKIQSFLENLPESNGLRAAAFDTRFKSPRLFTGSAARVIADELQKKGAKLVLAPESFFVEGTKGPLRMGEIERAEEWARLMLR